MYPTRFDCPPRFLIFYRTRENFTARVSPCDNSGMSSADDSPICEPTDEGLQATNPNKDWWDSNEAEQDREDDENDREIYENSPPLPRLAKKRYRPSTREKSFRRHGTKRHRFSSPFSSELEVDTSEESDHSIYTPSKVPDVSKFRSASSSPISLNRDASQGNKMKIVGEQSGMAVIYKQQSWEGEIVDERDTKQGRGRPRKQYLVRWKTSWVDGSQLTASELVQIWREKKASKNRC